MQVYETCDGVLRRPGGTKLISVYGKVVEVYKKEDVDAEVERLKAENKKLRGGDGLAGVVGALLEGDAAPPAEGGG